MYILGCLLAVNIGKTLPRTIIARSIAMVIDATYTRPEACDMWSRLVIRKKLLCILWRLASTQRWTAWHSMIQQSSLLLQGDGMSTLTRIKFSPSPPVTLTSFAANRLRRQYQKKKMVRAAIG